MRFIGIDAHRDYCEVVIIEQDEARNAGRVATNPAELELFARSLARGDEVVLEATANSLAIARIIRPHVARVVLANPKSVKGQARAKTDKIDARTLAQLLASGFVGEVWMVDEQTRTLRRRVARRWQLAKQRTREKNQIHAILARNLKAARRRPTSSASRGANGSPSRCCRQTSRRGSTAACAGSTS
jgi:transposase